MIRTTDTPAKSLKSVALRWNLVIGNHAGNRSILSTIGLFGEVSRRDALTDASNESVEEKIGRVEAVLFMAREPISSRKLSQHANLADGTEARTLVRKLNGNLDKFGRAFRVEEIAGGFQMVTRQRFSPWLRRLAHVPQSLRLSTPAMETLSVVAYRQPINRAEIESVRGVGCGEILNQLLGRDLVRICGRSEELGKPYLYGTSKRFLEMFGLRSLDDLPLAGTIHDSIEEENKNEGTLLDNSDRNQVTIHHSEEESGVSVSVELENHPLHPELDPIQSTVAVDDERELRSEDDDYDYDDDEEEEFEEDDDDEDDGVEEWEDDDEEEDDDLEDDDLDDDDAEDDDFEDDGEEVEDEEELVDDEEEEEWEEVEADDDEAEDWDEDDDDWEDDEEWEE